MGVQLIFLRSVSESGEGFFGMLVTVSSFQTSGQVSFFRHSFITCVTIGASCWACLVTNAGKMSPRSKPVGILHSFRRSVTWSVDTTITSSSSVGIPGLSACVSGVKLLEILQKKSATSSAVFSLV